VPPAAVVVLSLAALALVVLVGWRVIRRSGGSAQAPPSPQPAAPPAADPMTETESQRAEEKRLGGLYSSVFKSLADALIVIDERGRIMSFSPSAEATFGYAEEEVLGQSVSILMPRPDRDQHEEYVRQYVEAGWASGRMETMLLTGEAHIIRPARETVAVRKDGTTFPARLVVSEVEADGTRMFVGLLSDVSERKRLERELAARIESQAALLRELQDAYDVIEQQKARMQLELDVGREIQLAMVPHRFPRLSEADVWATLRPAREVGGDLYDVVAAPGGKLWLCVGDVSGKGVPSALFMAVTKTLIASGVAQGIPPGDVMTQVNAELARDNDSAMFVTAFLACLDPASGELRYSNAGHNPPLLRHAAGLERLATRHGPVLGALEGVTYGESVARLAPDDLLLLFTDGVTEALDARDQLFSEARLQEVFRTGQFESAEHMATTVVSAVDAFAGSREQSDDITVMGLRFVGAEPSRAERHFPFRIANRIEALAETMPEIETLVERCGGGQVAQRRFAVAFDELVSNIIKYAYPDGQERFIECELACVDGAIMATITDEGDAFNPLDLAEPDTSLALEEREIGGLGVHIVRRMFDEMRYERREGRNVTTIVTRD